MKGIILAGGLATRLRPLTWVTNKHLLPIYNRPMIFFPLEAMARAGIQDVLITSSSDHAGHFVNLLKGGGDFGLHLEYAIQDNSKGGIADAIWLGEEFAKDDARILVILGDNIFTSNLKESIERFEQRQKGAVVFGVKMATDSKQYGVIEVDKDGTVLSIEEKPEQPKSTIAQAGIYMYDQRVFSFIKSLTPSKRGELEVTDLNNVYVKERTMKCEMLDFWVDAGTSFDELLRANNLVAEKVKKGELV